MRDTDKPILSVVVPVGKLFGDTSALENWIPYSLKTQVILVLDQTDEKTLDSISQSKTFKNCKNVEIYLVSFGNPGETRNFGFGKTKGDWVTFSDSDDLPNIEVILTSIVANNHESAKVLIGNYEVYQRDTGIIKKVESDDLAALLKSLPSGLGLWRFVFRKKFLDDKRVRFPGLSMAEDQVYFLRLNIQQNEIKYEKKTFYRYFQGSPFQLTKDKARIQDLQKSIPETLAAIKKDSSTEIFDFFSAQLFSLILNGSKKHFVGNLKFSVKALIQVFHVYGIKKVALVMSYPIRRCL